jgi:hypothetical protein
MTNPRQSSDIGIAAEDQVGEGSPSKIGRGYSLAGVATGVTETRSSVINHRRPPIARQGHRPTPAVGNSSSGDLREQAPKNVRYGIMNPGLAVVIRTEV